jgi:NADP-dependent 3-hydroxy acid dehydrogenase YdfG
MNNVIVTGAGRGIGKEIVNFLSKNNFHVIATARNKDNIEEIFKGNENIECFELDVTDDKSIDQFKELIKDKDIDAVIHNAGGGSANDMIENSRSRIWDYTFKKNVSGPLAITSMLIPQLKRSSNPQVILITSVAGYYSYIGGGDYTVAKRAEIALAEALRIDLSRMGIKVTQIAPGSVNSGLEKQENALNSEDIAEAIRWILTLPKHVNIDNLDIMHINNLRYR